MKSIKSIKRSVLSKKNKNNLYNLKSLKKHNKKYSLRKHKQIGGRKYNLSGGNSDPAVWDTAVTNDEIRKNITKLKQGDFFIIPFFFPVGKTTHTLFLKTNGGIRVYPIIKKKKIFTVQYNNTTDNSFTVSDINEAIQILMDTDPSRFSNPLSKHDYNSKINDYEIIPGQASPGAASTLVVASGTASGSASPPARSPPSRSPPASPGGRGRGPGRGQGRGRGRAQGVSPANKSNILHQFDPHFPVVNEYDIDKTLNSIKGIIINDNDEITDDLSTTQKKKPLKQIDLKTKIVIFEYDNIDIDINVVKFLNYVITQKNTKLVIVSFQSLNNSIKKKLNEVIETIDSDIKEQYKQNINKLLIITPLNYQDKSSFYFLKIDVNNYMRKRKRVKPGIGGYNDYDNVSSVTDLKNSITAFYNKQFRSIDLNSKKIPNIVNDIVLFYFGTDKLVFKNVYYIYNEHDYSKISHFNSFKLESQSAANQTIKLTQDTIKSIKKNFNEFTIKFKAAAAAAAGAAAATPAAAAAAAATPAAATPEAAAAAAAAATAAAEGNKIVLIPLKTLIDKNKIENWNDCAGKILKALST